MPYISTVFLYYHPWYSVLEWNTDIFINGYHFVDIKEYGKFVDVDSFTVVLKDNSVTWFCNEKC
jgi:hypothetical protein